LPQSYNRFLRGVGLFGMGDFSHTLLILAATQLLTPKYGVVRATETAALLYVVRNVVYAAASFPIGALADRMDKQVLLALGYAIGAVTSILTAVLFAVGAGRLLLIPVFVLAGAYVAAEDALEGALPADLVESKSHGTAYGLMGTVNGAGDFAASALVGLLWTAVSGQVAFLAAALLMLLGAWQVLWNR